MHDATEKVEDKRAALAKASDYERHAFLRNNPAFIALLKDGHISKLVRALHAAPKCVAFIYDSDEAVIAAIEGEVRAGIMGSSDMFAAVVVNSRGTLDNERLNQRVERVTAPLATTDVSPPIVAEVVRAMRLLVEAGHAVRFDLAAIATHVCEHIHSITTKNEFRRLCSALSAKEVTVSADTRAWETARKLVSHHMLDEAALVCARSSISLSVTSELGGVCDMYYMYVRSLNRANANERLSERELDTLKSVRDDENVSWINLVRCGLIELAHGEISESDLNIPKADHDDHKWMYERLWGNPRIWNALRIKDDALLGKIVTANVKHLTTIVALARKQHWYHVSLEAALSDYMDRISGGNAELARMMCGSTKEEFFIRDRRVLAHVERAWKRNAPTTVPCDALLMVLARFLTKVTYKRACELTVDSWIERVELAHYGNGDLATVIAELGRKTLKSRVVLQHARAAASAGHTKMASALVGTLDGGFVEKRILDEVDDVDYGCDIILLSSMSNGNEAVESLARKHFTTIPAKLKAIETRLSQALTMSPAGITDDPNIRQALGNVRNALRAIEQRSTGFGLYTT